MELSSPLASPPASMRAERVQAATVALSLHRRSSYRLAFPAATGAPSEPVFLQVPLLSVKQEAEVDARPFVAKESFWSAGEMF